MNRHPAHVLPLALALAASALMTAACATAPASQTVAQSGAAAAPRTEQVCRKELPTGMRIPVTVCRDVKAMEQRSENDRAWADRIPTEVHDVGR